MTLPPIKAGGLLGAGSAASPPFANLVGTTQTSPVRPAQLIYFFGYLNSPVSQPTLVHRFQALCGEQPPTITGGWGNVAMVARPRSLDYTIVTDYPALTMDVSLRFDNWTNFNPPVNTDVEGDLSRLMWMWGRGKLGPGKPASGNPPIVKIGSYDGGTAQIPLIPPDVQDIEWIISNIQYDPGPLRFSSDMISARKLDVPTGSRGRQDVMVTLTQWVPAPGYKAQKDKPDNSVVYANAEPPKTDTIRSMCQNYFGKDQVSDYKQVMQLSANKKLHIRNPGQKLKQGTRVAFPATFKLAN